MKRISRDRINLENGLIFACPLMGANDTVDLVTGATPTITGTPTTATDGPLGDATTFSTTSGYAWPAQQHYAGLRQLTVTAWVKSGGDATVRNICGLNSAAGSSFSTIGSQVNDKFWRVGANGAVLITTTEWVFVAGVAIDYTNVITIPGDKKWSETYLLSNSSRAYNSAGVAALSAAPTASHFAIVGPFIGSVQNLCIWGRALSLAEIERARTWIPRR